MYDFFNQHLDDWFRECGDIPREITLPARIYDGILKQRGWEGQRGVNRMQFVHSQGTVFFRRAAEPEVKVPEYMLKMLIDDIRQKKEEDRVRIADMIAKNLGWD